MLSSLKKLLLIVFVSFFALLLAAGCGTSIEKPLTKEEAIQLEEELEDDQLLEEEQPGEEEEKNVFSETESDAEEYENRKNTTEDHEKSPSNKDQTEKTDLQSNLKNNRNKKEHQEAGKNETNKPNQSKNGEREQKNVAQSGQKTNSSSSQQIEKRANSKQENSSRSVPAENSNGKNQPALEKQEQKNTIVFSIVISPSEVPLSPTTMEINDGDTVLDALIRITKEKGIQMDYRGGRGATAYVEGIANVYEFDRGQGSGWMYRVNGIFPDRGAGVVPLEPGDRVEWLYTTNLGVDLGADLKPFRR